MKIFMSILFCFLISQSAQAGSVCWKNEGERKCINIKPPTDYCLANISLAIDSMDDFDLDGDGNISLNDIGLLVSELQKEIGVICSE